MPIQWATRKGGCCFQNNLKFYPSIGFGLQFLFKAAEMMLITVDYAKGEDDNSGYARFGQAF